MWEIVNFIIIIIMVKYIFASVLYDLYFLPHQFHFLSNLVPVVYEKTKMVSSSDFSFKTNVHPRHFLSCCCLDVVGNDV
jgi:hypothetical protein